MDEERQGELAMATREVLFIAFRPIFLSTSLFFFSLPLFPFPGNWRFPDLAVFRDLRRPPCLKVRALFIRRRSIPA